MITYGASTIDGAVSHEATWRSRLSVRHVHCAPVGTTARSASRPGFLRMSGASPRRAADKINQGVRLSGGLVLGCIHCEPAAGQRFIADEQEYNPRARLGDFGAVKRSDSRRLS
jgi:hypothetical protein